MPKPRALVIGLLLLLSNIAYVHANDRLFQIDMIVYANDDPGAVYEENWPDNLHLRYPRNWERLRSQGSGHLAPVAPSEEFAAVARSIKLSSRYRVLTQKSWTQELSNKRQAPAILIQGGRQVGEHYELEGYINVALERYLFVDTNLWLSSFGETSGRYYLPRQPENHDEPEEPGFIDESFAASPEYAEFLRQNPEHQARKEEESFQAPSGSQAVERIVVMEQTRRLRSEELHFFDHPLFGMLIRISAAPAVAESAPQSVQ